MHKTVSTFNTHSILHSRIPELLKATRYFEVKPTPCIDLSLSLSHKILRVLGIAKTLIKFQKKLHNTKSNKFMLHCWMKKSCLILLERRSFFVSSNIDYHNSPYVHKHIYHCCTIIGSNLVTLQFIHSKHLKSSSILFSSNVSFAQCAIVIS